MCQVTRQERWENRATDAKHRLPDEVPVACFPVTCRPQKKKTLFAPQGEAPKLTAPMTPPLQGFAVALQWPRPPKACVLGGLALQTMALEAK